MTWYWLWNREKKIFKTESSPKAVKFYCTFFHPAPIRPPLTRFRRRRGNIIIPLEVCEWVWFMQSNNSRVLQPCLAGPPPKHHPTWQTRVKARKWSQMAFPPLTHTVFPREKLEVWEKGDFFSFIPFCCHAKREKPSMSPSQSPLSVWESRSDKRVLPPHSHRVSPPPLY